MEEGTIREHFQEDMNGFGDHDSDQSYSSGCETSHSPDAVNNYS